MCNETTTWKARLTPQSCKEEQPKILSDLKESLFYVFDFFPPDMGKITDEHGERFHQTIGNIEKRYQGRADARMLADFCWSLDISSN
jgi:hypothetical protein